MAKLVQIICVTHNPSLPMALQKSNGHPGIERGKAKWEEMRQNVDEVRPDVLIVVANDHLNQWFMNNMPSFLIGKANFAEGPFAHEERDWGMPHYGVPVQVDVAKAIIEAGFREGVDFSFSDEFVLDHSFTVPLAFMRPEADIPIVPVFANVMAPPCPPSIRFYQVGEALRRIIEDLPSHLRVGAIYSGHLSVEVGGPRMIKTLRGQGSVDPDFDRQMTDLIRQGDINGILREATSERMQRAGNVTAAFMNFIMAMGMAGTTLPTTAESVFSDTNTMPFFTWDLRKETAA